MSGITYLDDHHLVVGDTHFHCAFPLTDAPAGRLAIMKLPEMVAPYDTLIEQLRPERIVELGIRRGGSTALINQLAAPEKLVAVELAGSAPDLDTYIASKELGARVRPYYGVDQADRARLRSIVSSEFGDALLDLVVDDASHLYQETRSSFETLFPLVRPGGVFVIEDWSTGHRGLDKLADSLREPTEAQLEAVARTMVEGPAPDRPEPLSRLVVELVLLRASAGDVVTSVDIGEFWVAVTRGSDPLDPVDFRLDDHYHDHWDMLGDRRRKWTPAD